MEPQIERCAGRSGLRAANRVRQALARCRHHKLASVATVIRGRVWPRNAKTPPRPQSAAGRAHSGRGTGAWCAIAAIKELWSRWRMQCSGPS